MGINGKELKICSLKTLIKYKQSKTNPSFNKIFNLITNLKTEKRWFLNKIRYKLISCFAAILESLTVLQRCHIKTSQLVQWTWVVTKTDHTSVECIELRLGNWKSETKILIHNFCGKQNNFSFHIKQAVQSVKALSKKALLISHDQTSKGSILASETTNRFVKNNSSNNKKISTRCRWRCDESSLKWQLKDQQTDQCLGNATKNRHFQKYSCFSTETMRGNRNLHQNGNK